MIPLFSFELLKKYEQMNSNSKEDEIMAIKLTKRRIILFVVTASYGSKYCANNI